MKTPVQLAVDALLISLDKTPRNNWEQTILMAIQSVRDMGYAEGYRTGSFELNKTQPVNDTGLEEGLTQMAGSHNGAAVPAYGVGPAYAATVADIAAAPQGEDKALSNDKPSDEEALTDLGYQFIGEIARQLGVIAKQYDVTPGSVRLVTEIKDTAFGKQAAVHLSLKNVTAQ